jgi:hypothetical protein
MFRYACLEFDVSVTHSSIPILELLNHNRKTVNICSANNSHRTSEAEDTQEDCSHYGDRCRLLRSLLVSAERQCGKCVF